MSEVGPIGDATCLDRSVRYERAMATVREEIVLAEKYKHRTYLETLRQERLIRDKNLRDYPDVVAMFAQAADLDPSPHIIKNGRHAAAFGSILADTTDQLHAIDPNLSPNHFPPQWYQSRLARIAFAEVDLWGQERVDFEDIRANHYDSLRYYGMAVGSLAQEEKVIIDGELDRPIYMHQGDIMASPNSSTACFTACFRMVYAGITGEALPERVVIDAMDLEFGTHLVDDEIFMNAFHTDAFKKASGGKQIRTMTFVGAHLGMIQKVSAAYKKRLPGSEVFCIVSLASEAVNQVWHTNVLLDANEEGVYVHDPSSLTHLRSPDKFIDHVKFHGRWAEALNRAHLIVAYKDDEQTQ